MSTDPYAQYHSPYLGMGNNPINGVDPDGGFETKFGAWWYRTFNGGGEIVKNEDDSYSVNQIVNFTYGDKTYKGLNVISAHKSNWLDLYTGPNNPMTFGNDNFSLAPRNLSDAVSRQHDIDYKFLKIEGPEAVVTSREAIRADLMFVQRQFVVSSITRNYDPITSFKAGLAGLVIGAAIAPKIGYYSTKATFQYYFNNNPKPLLQLNE